MKTRRHLVNACLLLALSLVMQWVIVARSTVPAIDSIRYLSVAQSMDRHGLLATLRTQPEQPLYPALVWLFHGAMACFPPLAPHAWLTSLQWAAAIPLCLSVVPLYMLLTHLVPFRAAMAGSLFFCVTSEVCRLGADGLSDSTSLMFCMLALCCAVVAMRGTRDSILPRAAWMAAAGLAIGLALMARSEALALPVALGIFLGWEALRLGREAWPRVLQATSWLALGLGISVIPYLILSDALSPRASLARLLGRRPAAWAEPLNAPAALEQSNSPSDANWHLPDGRRMTFGRKDHTSTSRFSGLGPTLMEILRESGQAFQYWLGGLALYGLWLERRRLARPPCRLVLILVAVYGFLVLLVTLRSGYLSSRHLVLLVALGLGWSGRGALDLGQRLAVALGTAAVRRSGNQPRQESSRRSSGWRWGVAALALLACLPHSLAPLHAAHGAHRGAAAWLLARNDASRAVLDTHGWTALYTGRKTYRYEQAPTAYLDSKLAYVVVEQHELQSDSRRAATLNSILAEASEPLACFPAPDPRHSVAVYRWYPTRFAQGRAFRHAR